KERHRMDDIGLPFVPHDVAGHEVERGWNHVVNRHVLVGRRETDVNLVGAIPWRSTGERRNLSIRVGGFRFRLVGGELRVSGLVDCRLVLNVGGVTDYRNRSAHSRMEVTEVGERSARI